MADTTQLLQDHALADSARRGSEAAFAELCRRHTPIAWRLAVAVTRDAGTAEAAVVSACAMTFASRPATSGVAGTEDVRSSLLAAVRHAAVAADQPSVAPPAGAGFDLDSAGTSVVLARGGFAALPERWRSILWLVDVEGLPLDQAARALEMAPPAAAALAERARLGLREQVLHAGVLEADPIACRRTSDSLSAYASETLTAPEERRVRRHLDGCAACRGRLAALDDLMPSLRGAALPLPLHLAGAATQRWSASLVRDGGPLHLALPGGRPVPVWAQRAVAGAVGAVVALGITGAVILAGGRGGRAGNEMTRPATADAPLGGDGESALGAPGLADLELGGAGFVTPSLSRRASTTSSSGDLARSSGTLPRTTGTALRSTSTRAPGVVPAPSGPAAPTPTPPPAPTPPPTTTLPPPTIPPLPLPDDQVTVGITDVVEATVGQDCTGASVLGTVVGCEPTTTSSDPVTLEAGGSTLTAVPLGL